MSASSGTKVVSSVMLSLVGFGSVVVDAGSSDADAVFVTVSAVPSLIVTVTVASWYCDRSPGVQVIDKRDETGYVTPKDAQGEFSVFVSRIRKDPTIANGLNMTREDGFRYEASLFGVLFATDDQREGMGAFVEKRPAVFKGK